MEKVDNKRLEKQNSKKRNSSKYNPYTSKCSRSMEKNNQLNTERTKTINN